MNTIHCRVKQNEYQDIGKRHVTPAEAIVLRAIHDPAAHTFSAQATTAEEQARYWKVLVTPVASGEAETVIHDDHHKEVSRHKRTPGEELARLRHLYPTKSRDNPKKHIIDELFPGLNPNLPETFQEIGLVVAAPDAERPKSARGHGPELATRSDDDRVVSYASNEPKAETTGAKAPRAPRAPKAEAPKAKAPRAPRAPKPEAGAGDPAGE